MKILLCISLSIILIFGFFPTKTAKAQETYLGYSRVLTNDTGFYSDSAGKNLKFYLPYGYFVKILEMGHTYTKVSYQNETSHFPYLTGYIKTLDLISYENTPVTPYPLISLTVLSDDVLFSDSNLQSSKVGVYANTLAIYYGELSTDKEDVVYVYCEGYLGYMRKSCFAPFSVPTHPEPIPSEKQEDITSQIKGQNTKSNQVENLQILIVASVSVIVVSFVYLIFRPSGKRVKEEFYKEE